MLSSFSIITYTREKINQFRKMSISTTVNNNNTNSATTTTASAPKSYKIFRRLPPFYTLQPNLQSQSKQIACWNDFILDVALAAFHQTGTLGIQVTPHSPLFKSPKEVNRNLSSHGARTVLRTLVENEGGHRCLPLQLEEDDDQNNENGKNDQQQQQEGDDGDDFEDVDDDEEAASQQQQNQRSIFANCDALVVFALPCEQIVKSIWEWHDELQTSNVFSVTEIAEDEDIKKRITKRVGNVVFTASSSSSNPIIDAGSLVIGESIICDGTQQKDQRNNSSMIHVTPLSAQTVIEAIMTAEHPAMTHMKRPSLLSGASGSLGLKFG